MTQAEKSAEQLRAVVSALMRNMRTDFMDQPRSWTEQKVLRQVAEGMTTTADLARALEITPQAMGAIVAGLEGDGLVQRRDDKDDGRRRVIAVTVAGKRAIVADRAARQDWLAKMIDLRLDANEQALLSKALPVLAKLTADVPV